MVTAVRNSDPSRQRSLSTNRWNAASISSQLRNCRSRTRYRNTFAKIFADKNCPA